MKKVLRPEFVAIAAIAAFLVAGTVLVQIPETTQNDLQNLGKASEIAQGAWINSGPLSLANLSGKVVMVDFWTYSCINCIRTLPYMNEWHSKYADKGLVIIGVHTPEFEFEKDYNNVKAAVEKYGIEYAVVQDNDYETWRAYGNNYWPRKYLVDQKGNIRYDHIGEGAYEETEAAIQKLLGLDENISADSSYVSNLSKIRTPELYLGYNFARAPLGNPEGFMPEKTVDYRKINVTQGNIIYLSGAWLNLGDRMIAKNDSILFLVYHAKDANIVAGGNATVKVRIDGLPLPDNLRGKDIMRQNNETVVKINEQRLYNIISAPLYSTYSLELIADPGFELYTFTFG